MPIYFLKKAWYNKTDYKIKFGEIMDKFESMYLLNMTDYLTKIEKMTKKQLLKEYEKIREKLVVKYLVTGLRNYFEQEENIADNAEEKDRIYIRKKLSAVVKMVSGQLSNFADNYSAFWKEINKTFIESTPYSRHANAILEDKDIAFSNKLSLQGLQAYKKFLLVLSHYLQKTNSFQYSLSKAIECEVDADKDKPRDNFYSKKFLPVSIETVYKNIVKSIVLEKQIKKINALKKENEVNM